MTARKESLHCVICGRDITRSMKIYPYGLEGGPYCYDCAEAVQKPFVPRKKVSVEQAVRDLHRLGKKPSEIAKAKGLSVSEVYEMLNIRKERRREGKS